MRRGSPAALSAKTGITFYAAVRACVILGYRSIRQNKIIDFKMLRSSLFHLDPILIKLVHETIGISYVIVSLSALY